MRLLLTGLTALILTSPLAAQVTPSTSVPAEVKQLALGHQLTEWFLASRMDSIVARMPDDVKEKSGGVASLQKARAQLAMRGGEEAKLLEEKMTRRKGLAQYWRSAMYTELPQEPIVVRWLFSDESQVVGFGLGPLSQTPAPDQ
ncbi:MAG: hypothetical protein ACJ8AU_06500 [Gemmatimonadales bacterium]